MCRALATEMQARAMEAEQMMAALEEVGLEREEELEAAEAAHREELDELRASHEKALAAEDEIGLWGAV